MQAALRKIPLVAAEFEKQFGRSFGGLIQEYDCADADYILVTMGSFTGTARVTAQKLRAEGKKSGF